MMTTAAGTSGRLRANKSEPALPACKPSPRTAAFGAVSKRMKYAVPQAQVKSLGEKFVDTASARMATGGTPRADGEEQAKTGSSDGAIADSLAVVTTRRVGATAPSHLQGGCGANATGLCWLCVYRC